MKTIKKGREQKGWAKEFECTGNGNGGNGCGAILLVEESDVKYTGSHHSYGDSSPDHYYGFVCQECGCVTDFKNNSDVPSRIINKIERVVDPSIKSKI
jgi:hypothetical protein